MLPDDPRHGTTAGWHRHRHDNELPCDPCRIAWNNYRNRYVQERELGYVRRISIDHGGAWERLDALRATGVTYRQIGAALDLPAGHVYKIHRRLFQTVTPETWRKLMAKVERDALWEPTQIGTIRRLRALHAIGWPGIEIARRSGLSREGMKKLLRGQSVETQHATRRAVAEVYDELWDKVPPRNSHTVRAINRSRREGWAPPLAWDDIDHDKKPSGHILCARPDCYGKPYALGVCRHHYQPSRRKVAS